LIEYDCLDKKDGVVFSSCYEGANLFAAYKIENEKEEGSFYDLILQNDINSKGNT